MKYKYISDFSVESLVLVLHNTENDYQNWIRFDIPRHDSSKIFLKLISFRTFINLLVLNLNKNSNLLRKKLTINWQSFYFDPLRKTKITSSLVRPAVRASVNFWWDIRHKSVRSRTFYGTFYGTFFDKGIITSGQN